MPGVKAVAIDKARLAVLMERGTGSNIPAWDLVVSDDLGATVRRSSLDGVTGNGREASLHLFQGRVFLLSSLTDSILATVRSARVFEIDPAQGTLMARGGAEVMSAVVGAAASDGSLTTVAFARARSPQVVAVTRFQPATDSIRRVDLACDVDGCDPAGLDSDFVSGDAETFDVVVSPAGRGPDSLEACVLTVRASTGTVESECLTGLATDIAPLSSFGGTPYDFGFLSPEGDDPSWLAPVTRHWIPSGERIVLGAHRTYWINAGFFWFSPSAFAVEGDTLLLRLGGDGKLRKTVVPHDSCPNLGPFAPTPGCPKVVTIRPLSGDEILFVTQRDQYQEEGRSRQLFEVARFTPRFEDFQP